MRAAGLEEYEFIATLDHRTTQRCRNLDGTVHLLEEFDTGTNAPPMHPRCRSTISAVISEGTRTARVKGKSIRIPAEMTYHDYKRVYVDKTLSLKDWQEANKIGGNADFRLTAEGNRDKIQYAKKKIILFEGLAKAVDVDKLAPVIDRVREAPEPIRAVWNLASKELKILNANYVGVPRYIYSPPHKGIVLNLADDAAGKDAKPYKHIFHESAHLIDSWMENYTGWRSVVYKGGIFAKTLNEEADSYIRKKALAENMSIGRAKFEIFSDLYKIDSMDVQEVSDIWDGITKSVVNGGYGHDKKYWEDPANLAKEAFANMFAATIYNENSLAQILIYFPKSYEIFVKMLKDYIEEAGNL